MSRASVLLVRLRKLSGRRWVRVLVASLIILWLTRVIATLVTDAQWYYALGYGEIWRGRVATRIGLFLGTASCAFAFAVPLLRAAMSLPESPLNLPVRHERLASRIQYFNRRAARMAWLVVTIVSLLLARTIAMRWSDWILFRNGSAFGEREGFLGRDIGFYVFRLPWWHLMLSTAWTLVVTTLLLTVVLTLGRAVSTLLSRAPHLPRSALRRIAGLAALLFVLRACGYHLAQFDAVTTQHPGEVVAAGMTFVSWHVRRPLLGLGVLLCAALAAVLGLYAARTDRPVAPAARPLSRRAASVLVLLTAAAAAALFAPAILTRIGTAVVRLIVVAPDAERRELPYLRDHLQATRAAWQLDSIRVAQHRVAAPLSASLSAVDLDTVRVWNTEQLEKVAQAHETSGPQYQLSAMHLDRYASGGRRSVVGIAVREIRPSGVPTDWINRHATDLYTHGIGAVIYEAAASTATGDPPALLSGRPPSATPPKVSEVPGLREPGMWYGQTAQPYALLAEGTAGGVAISSWWWRLMWAWRLGDINLLLHPMKDSPARRAVANAATAASTASGGSRLLFRRSMSERAEALAPFLVPDGDPYPVVYDGHLVWMLDLLTATATYPAARSPDEGALRGFNAASDSVKMVMDAVQGRVAFYVASGRAGSDPLLRAWRRAFPTLVRPLEDMPPALREHRRYPRSLFATQLEALGRYHTTSPASFYKRDEVWAMESRDTPPDTRGDRSPVRAVPSYALLPELPDSTRAAAPSGALSDTSGATRARSRFALQAVLTLFSLQGKTQPMAQLTADCDGDEYGRLTLTRFGAAGERGEATWLDSQALIARLDGDARIAEDAEPGDVLLAPSALSGGRVLLFAPYYLSSGGVMRLAHVAVADASSPDGPIGVGDNKHSAVASLLRSQPDNEEEVAALAAQALDLQDRIQEAARHDWARYGELMARQREVLQRLQQAAK